MKQRRAWFILLSLVLTFVFAGSAMAVTYEGYTQEAFDALTETTVIASEDSPTGYYVTFRYVDPDAQRVRIRGEWSFATDRGSFYPMSDNIMPEDYEVGMFPLQVDQKDWPAFDMVKDDATGIWHYTAALYSGTWSYRFIIDGAEGAAMTDYTDAVQTTDPNNRPIERSLAEQTNSQVRVPYHEKQDKDLTIQLPRGDEQVGTLEIIAYEAEGVPAESIVMEPALAVYLPYGYDAERTEPYNVLYLSHGAGVESETSWVNKGSVVNMMDNLIADYGVEPFVLVSLNNYAVGFNPENLCANIVPLIEGAYNVSTVPEGKAVAGLSRGAQFTQNQMLINPEAFGFYGLFSGGFFSDDAMQDVSFDAEALADATIYLAAGSKEFGLLAIQRTATALVNSGITRFDSDVVTGGHDWFVWRENFVDFVLHELW